MTSRLSTASGDSLIDTLLTGHHWSGTVGWSMSATPGSEYLGTGSLPGSPHLRDAVEAVLAQVASFTGIDFAEAGSGATVRVFTGDWMSFSDAGRPTTVTLGAYAFFPGETALAGDVWLGSAVLASLDPGTHGYRTLMHEIGHALGLKQPDEAGPFGRLSAHRDGAEWSVMSARSVTGGPAGVLGIEPQGYAETFMIRDIAALQHLYGADYSVRTNDVYVFDPFQRVMARTIWDGGGRDTYDFSRYATALSIDLGPGGWSTTGQEAQLNRAEELATGAAPVYAAGSVYNAALYQGRWRSGIENAIGGAGDDHISGNRLGNHLTGGAGDDVMSGHSARDTLHGGAGDDLIDGGSSGDVVIGGLDDDTLLGRGGKDTVYGASGDDRVAGAKHDDVLHGGAGNDRVRGASGDDRVRGGAGADTLHGGEGSDRLTGGAGADVFDLRGHPGSDTITDFAPGLDRLDVDDPAAAYASALTDGADTILALSPSDSVRLVGVDRSDLTLDAFI